LGGDADSSDTKLPATLDPSCSCSFTIEADNPEGVDDLQAIFDSSLTDDGLRLEKSLPKRSDFINELRIELLLFSEEVRPSRSASPSSGKLQHNNDTTASLMSGFVILTNEEARPCK
jgi:hypothetical protein